jgi:CRP/FNR family cyclic AMP-dependent transcriptional regulator
MSEEEADKFDYRAFIAKYGEGTVSNYPNGKSIYGQGDPADALFYIISGTVTVNVVSEHGKAAVAAMLSPGDFFGEGCLDRELLRLSEIVTADKSEIARFNSAVVLRALKDDLAFSKVFLRFLLDRNEKLKVDLISHLFDSSEKRLARILLTLAQSGLANPPDCIDISINQDMLAMMVGTTRPRINQFMNKFRKFGYIEYNGHIKVRSSLLNVIVDDTSVMFK